MDIADQAQIEIERTLERSLSRFKAIKPEPREVCECGEKIPQARRELGYGLCVYCAEKIERTR